ncbi:MAG: NUDIX hydrolase [Candidatus Niyogibacteria bacterium]|nr:MAG: NUDIX hydrolase [Candidatus Niyogibacteria bacterium]
MNKSSQKYKFAAVAVDVIIFSIDSEELKVLLIEMKKRPYVGFWAAPGGLIKADESLDQAAKRQLSVKAGLKNVYLEQLYTFGEVNRDPFGRVVSTAYFALIPRIGIEPKTSKEYGDIKWFGVKTLPKLAYDHKKIIGFALERLRSKIGYTNIIYGLLPREFTLSDLQKVYEIILAKKLDKRNFRKKALSIGLVKPVSAKRRGAHRPAALYKFIKNRYHVIEIL